MLRLGVEGSLTCTVKAELVDIDRQLYVLIL